MAPHQVSITKRTLWRGQQEQFSNVYHYDTPTITTDAGWDDLIDAIVAIERPLHSPSVTYVQARVNGPTNQGAAANVMKRIKDLSGAGTMPGTGGEFPPESTVVASFYIGRSALGRKRFLRKYFHSCKLPSTNAGSVTFGQAAMAQADKNTYISAMNNLKTLSIGGVTSDLCAPNGDHLPLGSDPTVLDFLHTRQFRA